MRDGRVLTVLKVPRGELADPLMTALQPLQRAWRSLGLTPTAYSWGKPCLLMSSNVNPVCRFKCLDIRTACIWIFCAMSLRPGRHHQLLHALLQPHQNHARSGRLSPTITKYHRDGTVARPIHMRGHRHSLARSWIRFRRAIEGRV